MRNILLIGIFCVVQFRVLAQNEFSKIAFDVDTNYIESYYNDLIVRVYSSNKNNFIRFKDVDNDLSLKYMPNDFYNIGVGFNYKWFGLNLGTKIPFLSNDDDKYGKTSTFGLQSYIYARRFTLDVLAIKKKGYYLNKEEISGFSSSNDDDFYKRRDLVTKDFGVNFNYVVNYRKFSYKAAFKQNELQKRSAGSVILGAGVFALKVDADSAFVPREIGEEYFSDWRDLNAFKSYSVAANAGYAYSLVPAKNWIVTGSFRLGLVVQRSRWNLLDEESWKTKIGRSSEFRLSGGHHFSDFYLGASFVRYQQSSTMEHHLLNIKNGTNFLEFTASKRIKL